DPGITSNGVAVANPNDPKKSSPGSLLITGVIENGSNGGDVETQAVHTLSDIPISAYGPGASQFARVSDNTEAFFYIMNSILGTYRVPVQFWRAFPQLRRRAGRARRHFFRGDPMRAIVLLLTMTLTPAPPLAAADPAPTIDWPD